MQLHTKSKDSSLRCKLYSLFKPEEASVHCVYIWPGWSHSAAAGPGSLAPPSAAGVACAPLLDPAGSSQAQTAPFLGAPPLPHARLTQSGPDWGRLLLLKHVLDFLAAPTPFGEGWPADSSWIPAPGPDAPPALGSPFLGAPALLTVSKKSRALVERLVFSIILSVMSNLTQGS